MFQNWGFLVGEIWALLALAALIGLVAGWLIWGGSRAGSVSAKEAQGLNEDLARLRKSDAQKDGHIRALNAEIENLRLVQAPPAPATAPPKAEPVRATEPEAADPKGKRPVMLNSARPGGPDDLKRIKGVGPKLEEHCHSLGIYHFDQIASWSAEEVAWVDLKLEGFKGRVSRDNWVAQATILASGGETAFSKKVSSGEVY
ncbi:MAG: hypothetical protein AAFR53_03175 [Pseudomonadota bacterium]